MTERVEGLIRVTDDFIRVEVWRTDPETKSSSMSTRSYKATVENLLKAAEALAYQLELSYADREKEMKRIHEVEQADARLRDEIEKLDRELREKREES